MIALRQFAVAAFASIASLTVFAQQPQGRRSLEELINRNEPGWDLVQKWIKEAKNAVEVLPSDPVRADSALLQAQVTTRSPMGAIIHGSGGILVDHGWIRILGSSNARLGRSVMEWNRGKSFEKIGERPSFLLVADDALGGFFAINAGALDTTDMGKVFYFGPENLTWVSTGLAYSEFLVFCFSGDLNDFYQGLRWKGWESEVGRLDGDQAFHCVPYLFTAEGKNIAQVDRKAVPIQELWDLYMSF
ncbi:MAG: DUF2625 domain-containing protein [Flavobacteriales bacterium]